VQAAPVGRDGRAIGQVTPSYRLQVGLLGAAEVRSILDHKYVASRLERFAHGVCSILVIRPQPKEIAMNKDQIKGSADQAKGAVKEVVGKTVGDKKMQAEGTVEKLTGKLERAVGGAKETIGDAINKARK